MAVETESVLYGACFLFDDMCTNWWRDKEKYAYLHLHSLDQMSYIGAHT
jgi:hypothetical protein